MSGAIAYDFLFCRGGAEKLTLAVAGGIRDTDIVVSFRDRAIFTDDEIVPFNCHELGSKPRTSLRGWRTLLGLYRFRRRARMLANYDWVIFSGSVAPEGVWNRPRGRNLYYCHTPPRVAYDLYDYYAEQVPALLRPAFRLFVGFVRKRYRAAIARMDVILANSANVQRRLYRYLGVDSVVVHPPCDTKGFGWISDEGYFVSTARLEPYKRVDRIIEAFRGLPDKQLVVASGGSDEARLRHMARDCANIRFTGWQTATQLQDLVGRARASIYVARDEDFGMAPVESMAAGKPVIGAAEGGLLETVLDGHTGILLQESDPAAIAEAARALTAERAAGMRSACEGRAAEFSTERFLESMQEAIELSWSRSAGSAPL